MTTPNYFRFLAFTFFVALSVHAYGHNETITDVEQIVDVLPRELIVELRGPKKAEAALKANEILLSKFRDRPVDLKLKAQGVLPGTTTNSKNAPTLRAENSKFKKGVLEFIVVIGATFKNESAEKVLKLKKGAAIRVTGEIGSSVLFSSQNSPAAASLQITIMRATLADAK